MSLNKTFPSFLLQQKHFVHVIFQTLRLVGVERAVKDHCVYKRGKPTLPRHGLHFPNSSKGSFICTIPQTGGHTPRPMLHQLCSTGWNDKYFTFFVVKTDNSHCLSGYPIQLFLVLELVKQMSWSLLSHSCGTVHTKHPLLIIKQRQLVSTFAVRGAFNDMSDAINVNKYTGFVVK